MIMAEGVSASSGPVEIRATMIDVGRLEPGDARVAPVTAVGVPWRLATRRSTRSDGRSPVKCSCSRSRGVTSAQPATTAKIRALALEPWRFEGQRVTLVGQFRGRNLLGDLPASPAKGRYEFVLRSADGAVWVTGLRPRARNVELSVDARVDTGRWVQVAGRLLANEGSS